MGLFPVHPCYKSVTHMPSKNRRPDPRKLPHVRLLDELVVVCICSARPRVVKAPTCCGHVAPLDTTVQIKHIKNQAL